MIIREIEKPFDIILEARNILSERFKMFFSFLFFNAVCCLIVNFLFCINKPYLWFCGLFLGCYLLYDLKIRQEHYYKSVSSLKFSSVIELEKALNMKVDEDEWDTIKDIHRKNENLLSVENGFFAFFCISYFMVFVRIVLSLIDNHGVLK
ncbi:RipA family octameric membrane protein [Helicobacter pylori]|uniref:RipA family octameric membrane protein n=1 Tax=Helicobacter pylori TaxID=210 RepID=UPI0004A2CBDB|nr:hypothetical protein [Helicobacter pylori]